MLQLLLRNRVFFMMCLATIWILIFLMPTIGKFVKTKRIQLEKEKRLSERKPVYELRKEELPINHLHAGMFSHETMCLDSLGKKEGDKPGLWKCHGEGRHQFWFIMKETNALRNKELCLQGPKEGKVGPVFLQKCDAEKETQAWLYENGSIMMSGSELCLEAQLKDKKIEAVVCEPTKKNQIWKLETPLGY